MGLGEYAASIVEVQSERGSHVTTAHTGRADDIGAKPHRDVIDNHPSQPFGFRRVPRHVGNPPDRVLSPDLPSAGRQWCR